jgi:hypothetical protein
MGILFVMMVARRKLQRQRHNEYQDRDCKHEYPRCMLTDREKPNQKAQLEELRLLCNLSHYVILYLLYAEFQ